MQVLIINNLLNQFRYPRWKVGVSLESLAVSKSLPARCGEQQAGVSDSQIG